MHFSEYLKERTLALTNLASLDDRIEAIASTFVEALEQGNKILTCGNGGSAAEAQHFSTELIGRFKSNRRSLPAVSLNADGSLLTCIANDFGADSVFSRQIEGLARPGDCLAVFSSSGNSSNIHQALTTARELDIQSIALLGKDGGRCAGLASLELIVPATSTAVVQEMQLLLIHFICEKIESAFQ